MGYKRINRYYRLSGGLEKKFFLEKYETTNPIARIDMALNLNLENIVNFEDYINESYAKRLEGYYLSFCIHIYWVRAKYENLPLKGKFLYCHIRNTGEVIHSYEIGEEVNEEDYYQTYDDNVNDISVYSVYDEIQESRCSRN